MIRRDQNSPGIGIENAAASLRRNRSVSHELPRQTAGRLVPRSRFQEAIDIRRQPLRRSRPLARRLGLNRARRQNRLGWLRRWLRIDRLDAWLRLAHHQLRLAKYSRDSSQVEDKRQQPSVAISSKTTCRHFCLAWIYCQSSIYCRFLACLTPIPSWQRPCSFRCGSRSRKSRCP